MALNRSDGQHVVTLIQGPPGTGKTSVISAILAGLLWNNPFKGGSGPPAPPIACTGQALCLKRTPTRRVLVCAQSNAAIDELLTRLNSRGLPTGSGTSRSVAMLRLGNLDSTHPAALQFHIDYVVDALGGGQLGTGGHEQATKVRQLRQSLLSVVQRIESCSRGRASGMVPQHISTS
jgi:superfamily I DNA and/or RNA helicase